MARKNIIIANLEKGLTCINCGLSYRKFMSIEEKNAWDAQYGKSMPNACGSKLRKKIDLPKDLTCEHWYNGTETFNLKNRLSDEKKENE